MSWGDTIVRLLVTEDCRVKAIIRYELIQLECRLRRHKPMCYSSDLNATYENTTESFDDTSLLPWLEKMFEFFVSSCSLAGLNGTEMLSDEQSRTTSPTKINQLFKLISEAQKVSRSYDKNG